MKTSFEPGLLLPVKLTHPLGEGVQEKFISIDWCMIIQPTPHCVPINRVVNIPILAGTICPPSFQGKST